VVIVVMRIPLGLHWIARAVSFPKTHPALAPAAE
jgi:hypothetical protein